MNPIMTAIGATYIALATFESQIVYDLDVTTEMIHWGQTYLLFWLGLLYLAHSNDASSH